MFSPIPIIFIHILDSSLIQDSFNGITHDQNRDNLSYLKKITTAL